MEEASRNLAPSHSFFLIGEWDHSSSSSSLLGLQRTLVTTGGGSDDGCSIGEAEGEAELDPIRVILENGRGMEGSCSFGRELGVIKEVIGPCWKKICGVDYWRKREWHHFVGHPTVWKGNNSPN